MLFFKNNSLSFKEMMIMVMMMMMMMMMVMNCLCGMVDQQKAISFALFLVGTIARDPYHLKSPTRREQDLNLRRT